MSEVVIEHVSIADLPDAWRSRLRALQAARVTVRIKSEDSAAAWPDNFFSQVAGGWQGEALTRAPQGVVAPRAALN